MPVSNLAGIEHLVSEIRNNLASTPGRPTPSGPPRADLFPALSQAELEQEEARLGFNLPPLLGQLYTRIANGGFGPGGGLLTVRQLSPKVDRTIATMYLQFRTARAKRGAVWQEGVVPFASRGDMILSCVDLSDPSTREDPPVVRYEPNMSEVQTHANLKGAPFRGAGLIPERESAFRLGLRIGLKGGRCLIALIGIEVRAPLTPRARRVVGGCCPGAALEPAPSAASPCLWFPLSLAL
jgi:hypothetical protein